MLVDDKQAREKILGLYAELVDRLYAQSEVSRGEGWDEVAKLDSDAAKVIESLSAQVADWRGRLAEQCGKTLAAEAQVAELQRINGVLETSRRHYAELAAAKESGVSP